MTKHSVLAILKNSDTFVSGEAISKSLGISRMAVSAAVKTLRADGYAIESVTRRGYRLINSPDRLTEGELLSRLTPERMASVMCLESVDTTNRKLRDLADSGAPDGQIVIANEQTAGRGRRGRRFMSLKDKGIYFSALLRPDCPAAILRSMTAWTAVAVCRAIEKATGLQPQIKWVNDLILGRRKICGILTELSLDAESGAVSSVITGIGINVNQTEDDFPEELRGKAGSLYMVAGHPFSRAAIAAALVEEIDQLRENWPDRPDPYLSCYRASCLSIGTDVTVISGNSSRKAFSLGIGDDFSLRVRYEDGTCEDLTSGEISVRGPDGYL